jgi:hypothetical protein
VIDTGDPLSVSIDGATLRRTFNVLESLLIIWVLYILV